MIPGSACKVAHQGNRPVRASLGASPNPSGSAGSRGRIERTFSAPLPQGKYLIAIITTQPGRRFGQEAEQDRPIVLDKFDDTGLHDEAAELDEVSRAFAPLHSPVAAVMTCHGQAETVAR